MSTLATMLLKRSHDDAPALVSGDRRWTWRQFLSDSLSVSSWLDDRLNGSLPPHVGVLLGNVPEFLLVIAACALSGKAVVGLNPTRRDNELARDVSFTDCQLVITDTTGVELLDGLDISVPIVGVDSMPVDGDESIKAPDRNVAGDDLVLLLFTSGTTDAPKAVRCSQARMASIAHRAAEGYGFARTDVCYCPMPLFHGNALMALWAPALHVGASVALPVGGRFSASRFLDEVRGYGATRFSYVGKALSYVLSTPHGFDDADNPLQHGFGTEASTADRAEFEERFGCRLVEGYGSSEGGIAINVTADTPAGSLGVPAPGQDVVVCDPDTLEECQRARFDEFRRVVNAGEAIGEIASRNGSFEGYYENRQADIERLRSGMYFSGDLGYRDEQGFFYFAGRHGDWLRVDSENFAASPVERIIERYPDVAGAAVYAVPDPRSGDEVMAALEMRPGRHFDPGDFGSFLELQPDLGTKWAPRYIRIVEALPVTATSKITKQQLRKEGVFGQVFWRSVRGPIRYELMSDEARERREAELARHRLPSQP